MSVVGTDRASEYFIAGGTLYKDAPCYVVRPADEALYAAVRRGDFCYVLTSRQMGKSSLMLRTSNRLREEGIAVVTLDLTRFGAHNLTVEQWYAGLLSEVGRVLDVRKDVLAYWRENALLPPAQRFFDALREIVLARVPGQVVLFVDEVDTVRSLPFSADEFFSGIRSCYNRRTEDPEMGRLLFGLFGVASPSDLIQDPRVTPFNVGTRIELTDFAFADALVLAEGLGKNGREKLKRVFYWTNGHPYLTLKLCRALAEDKTTTSARDVDRHANALFFCANARETDDNLLFVRRWLLESGVDVAGILDLYRQVWQGKRVIDDDTNPLVEVLHLSGIVTPSQRRLTVRNRLYRRVFDRKWITDHMPDAELRRQRAAFRRGVFRTGWLGGAVAAVTGSLAIYAFFEKSRADQLALQAQQEAHLSQTKESRATLLARQMTNMARQLARTKESAAKIAELRQRIEKLAQAQPPVPPSPTPPALLPVVDKPLAEHHTVVKEGPSPSTAPSAPPSPAAVAVHNAPIPPVITPPDIPDLEEKDLAVDIDEGEGNNDTEPQLLHQPPLRLPPRLKRMRYKGSATFRVIVNPDGSHKETLVQGTDHPFLDLCLIAYMARFKWTPATKNGLAVRAETDYALPLDIHPADNRE